MVNTNVRGLFPFNIGPTSSSIVCYIPFELGPKSIFWRVPTFLALRVTHERDEKRVTRRRVDSD